jgi:polyhydroxybutyrate depolymerase
MVNASTLRARKAVALKAALAIGCLLALGEACSQTSGTGASAYDGGPPIQGGNSGGTTARFDDSGGSGSEPSNDAGTPAAASDSGSTKGPEGDTGTPPAIDASTSANPDSGPTVVTCPTTALQPGDSNGSVMSGGAMRTYILHVPTGYTGKTPIPVVVDYHSLGGTSSGEKGISGYATLGDTEGYATVYPQGIDNAWNIGPCCTTSRTVDDLAFTRALVKDVQAKVCVDPKRIYAVGYSMGGGMSHYLGCNAADLFAAIAPAAFDLLIASEEPCNPSRPITEISFRGTADPLVNYDGGASMPPSGLQVTIHFLGAQGTFQKWAQLDGCTGSPSAPDSNGCSTYSQCKDGVEATLCTKQGGSHDPGNQQLGWAMLKAHPMP